MRSASNGGKPAFLHRPADLMRDPMDHDSAKLSPHGAIESSRERDSMARRRYQKGQLWLDGKTWYGRWREDVLVGGIRKRIRREDAIGSLKDYPTKRLAQRALDDRIAHVNKLSYRPKPTAKFPDFARNWKEKMFSQFRHPTAINYRTH